MKNYLSTHLLVAANAVALAVILVGVAWVTSAARQDTVALLEKNIAAQVKVIEELAELTYRNAADEVTEKIISDCPRRVDFENQLATLGTASKKDLINIQQLFESCGAFYAERKALVVLRLEREYSSLTDDLAVLATLRDLTPREQKYKDWKSLIDFEKTRRDLLAELTDIQGEIIQLLITSSNNRVRIAELVQQAQNVNQSLSVTNAQIDEVRQSLKQ